MIDRPSRPTAVRAGVTNKQSDIRPRRLVATLRPDLQQMGLSVALVVSSLVCPHRLSVLVAPTTNSPARGIAVGSRVEALTFSDNLPVLGVPLALVLTHAGLAALVSTIRCLTVAVKIRERLLNPAVAATLHREIPTVVMCPPLEVGWGL